MTRLILLASFTTFCAACWWLLLTYPHWVLAWLGANLAWMVVALEMIPRVQVWLDKRRGHKDWPRARVVVKAEEEWGN